MSGSLQRVELVNVGATDRLFIAIGEALAANPSMPLAVLDLSNNPYGARQEHDD